MFRRRFKLSKTEKDYKSKDKKQYTKNEQTNLNPKTLTSMGRVLPLHNIFGYKYETLDIATKIFLDSSLTQYGDRAFIFKYENSNGDIKEFNVNILNPFPFSEELWDNGQLFYVMKYKNKFLLPPEQYSNIKTIWDESQYIKLENKFLFKISSNTDFTKDNISDFYELYDELDNTQADNDESCKDDFKTTRTIIDIDEIMDTPVDKIIDSHENNVLDDILDNTIETTQENEQQVIIRTLYTEHKTRKSIYKHNRIYFYNEGYSEPFFMLSFCNKNIKK